MIKKDNSSLVQNCVYVRLSPHENLSHTDFLPDDYISDVPLLGCSQDYGGLNNNGLLLLDFCKQTRLCIMNGRLDKDLNENFTYVGRTGSSVVDYVIATQNLFPFVNHFKVHEPNLFSDHCVVDFAFAQKMLHVRTRILMIVIRL